ncbi:hypothetical protein [Paraburkholderia sp.]|jgi:hypothetical protein|uniref:hypothetical protein n=1 Tax=Paraburkholderia sp. TaxID=1926495 RepID=UPI002F419B43
MALIQSLQVFDVGPERQRTPSVSRHNVIPFPSPRVQLPVTLLSESEEDSRAQLRALLHSPLGVYVISTELVRNQVRLQLDIAPDDLDFTMHALITSLPHAMIGPLKRRNVTRETR